MGNLQAAGVMIGNERKTERTRRKILVDFDGFFLGDDG